MYPPLLTLIVAASNSNTQSLLPILHKDATNKLHKLTSFLPDVHLYKALDGGRIFPCGVGEYKRSHAASDLYVTVPHSRGGVCVFVSLVNLMNGLEQGQVVVHCSFTLGLHFGSFPCGRPGTILCKIAGLSFPITSPACTHVCLVAVTTAAPQLPLLATRGSVVEIHAAYQLRNQCTRMQPFLTAESFDPAMIPGGCHGDAFVRLGISPGGVAQRSVC